MESKMTAGHFVGGKGGPGVFQKIINLIPPHQVFIEPFAGEGTIARKLRPCGETILIDKVRHPRLLDTVAEIPGCVFVHGCGIGFIDAYRFKGREVVYIDPPYLLAARAQRMKEYYAEELPDAQHARLLRIAKEINTRVLISGYSSPLYDRELAEWNRIEFQTMTRGGTLATEIVWFNFPRPLELHDYRYVGDDWPARRRLKKKINRAVADLVSMPPLERGAMFAALGAAMKGPPSISGRASSSKMGGELLSRPAPDGEDFAAAAPANSGQPAGNFSSIPGAGRLAGNG